MEEQTAPIGSYGPGHTLWGKYHINKLVGIGGIAEVYRAMDDEGNVVAAKILSRRSLNSDTNPYTLTQFQKEAGIHKLMNHPHIVSCQEAFTGPLDPPGMILQYIHGSNVAILIENLAKRLYIRLSPEYFKEFSKEHILPIVKTVGSALSYMHAQHLVHCDVKPGNILIQYEDGQVVSYLTDFSTSVHLSDRYQSDRLIQGAPLYMAPEQFEGKPLDARTDIYALAITIYQLFSAGNHPIWNQQATDSEDHNALKEAHLTIAPTPLRHFNANASPEIESILTKALAKNPDDRFQTVQEFCETLVNLIGEPSFWKNLTHGIVRRFLPARSRYKHRFWEDLYSMPPMESGFPGQHGLQIYLEITPTGTIGPITQEEKTVEGIQHVYDEYGTSLSKIPRKLRDQPKVFISYAHADGSALANMFDKGLREHGFSTWWDRGKKGVTPGSDWDYAIRQAIDHSDALVVIMTNTAQRSRYVRSEWRYALDVRQIPVLVVITHGLDTDTLPLVLRELQWIDSRADLSRALDELSMAIPLMIRRARTNRPDDPYGE